MARPKAARRRKSPSPGLPSDLEDEVDKHFKGRDSGVLRLVGEEQNESSEEEEALGLSGSEDDSDFDSDDEDTKLGRSECNVHCMR